MRIALDYDQTYTLDPETWEKVIERFTQAGHEVMIVTFRDPGIPIEMSPGAGDGVPPIPVYYTSYCAKREFMRQRGIEIDIWIDDSPETIITNSQWTTEERERWKAQHEEDISNRITP